MLFGAGPAQGGKAGKRDCAPFRLYQRAMILGEGPASRAPSTGRAHAEGELEAKAPVLPAGMGDRGRCRCDWRLPRTHVTHRAETLTHQLPTRKTSPCRGVEPAERAREMRSLGARRRAWEPVGRALVTPSDVRAGAGRQTEGNSRGARRRSPSDSRVRHRAETLTINCRRANRARVGRSRPPSARRLRLGARRRAWE